MSYEEYQKAHEAHQATFEEIKADFDRFERGLKRQRKIGMWFVIPYSVGGLLVGIGVSDVADYLPQTRGALLELGVGFVLLVGCQWAQPYWIDYLKRKGKLDGGDQLNAPQHPEE